MATGYRLTASTGIHKGDREYQQDQIALLKHSRINGCILAIVADGMGGRSGGRKASDQVMMTAKQLFERYDPETDDAAAILSQIVQEAQGTPAASSTSIQWFMDRVRRMASICGMT